MGSLLVIASFLIVAMHDAVRDEVPSLLPAGVVPSWIIAFGVPLGAWLAAHGLAWVAGRELDRSGRLRIVIRAENMLALVRWFSVLWLWPALDSGWGALAARLVFHAPGLGEVVTIAPVLVTAVLTWWSFAPIDRRLREAVLFRQIADGAPVFRPPTTGQYIVTNIRHQILLMLVPITLMHVWSGVSDAIALARPESGGWLYAVGAIFIIAAMPWVLRVIWVTTPLGPGPLRTMLLDICRRNRVRLTELLVWRTHGTTVNAMVTGFVAPARFMLMSDALLEGLSTREIEAVAGHEVGHIRRRHLVWLAVFTTVIAAGAIGLLTPLVSAMVLPGDALELGVDVGPEHSSSAIEWIIIAGVTLAAVMGFGTASRTFELQADAFAVQDMSRALNARAPSEPAMQRVEAESGVSAGPTASPAAGMVRDEAVDAMQAALRRVAILNGITPRRFTFRHGSINQRLLHLQSLRGRPIAALPIDRRVRRAKWLVVGAVVCVVVISLLSNVV